MPLFSQFVHEIRVEQCRSYITWQSPNMSYLLGFAENPNEEEMTNRQRSEGSSEVAGKDLAD